METEETKVILTANDHNIGTNQHAVNERIKTLEHWLERLVVIPVINKPFGLDVLLDIIPVGGSVISALMGSYLTWEARNLGMPNSSLIRMLGNIGFDAVLGAIPWVGVVPDFFFRSNTRNLKMIQNYFGQPSNKQQRLRSDMGANDFATGQAANLNQKENGLSSQKQFCEGKPCLTISGRDFRLVLTVGEVLESVYRSETIVSGSGGGGKIDTSVISGQVFGSTDPIKIETKVRSKTILWIKTENGVEEEWIFPGEFSARKGHKIILVSLVEQRSDSKLKILSHNMSTNKLEILNDARKIQSFFSLNMFTIFSWKVIIWVPLGVLMGYIMDKISHRDQDIVEFSMFATFAIGLFQFTKNAIADFKYNSQIRNEIEMVIEKARSIATNYFKINSIT